MAENRNGFAVLCRPLPPFAVPLPSLCPLPPVELQNKYEWGVKQGQRALPFNFRLKIEWQKRAKIFAHPCREGWAGWRHGLKAFAVSRAKDCHATWCRPLVTRRPNLAGLGVERYVGFITTLNDRALELGVRRHAFMAGSLGLLCKRGCSEGRRG